MSFVQLYVFVLVMYAFVLLTPPTLTATIITTITTIITITTISTISTIATTRSSGLGRF